VQRLGICFGVFYDHVPLKDFESFIDVTVDNSSLFRGLTPKKAMSWTVPSSLQLLYKMLHPMLWMVLPSSCCTEANVAGLGIVKYCTCHLLLGGVFLLLDEGIVCIVLCG